MQGGGVERGMVQGGGGREGHGAGWRGVERGMVQGGGGREGHGAGWRG